MNDEQFMQHLKEHEAYRVLGSKHVKYSYFCGVCHVEHWLSANEIMAQTNIHTFPCGHDWNKTYYKPAEWEAFKSHNPLPILTSTSKGVSKA